MRGDHVVVADFREGSAPERENGQQGLTGGNVERTPFVPLSGRGWRYRAYFRRRGRFRTPRPSGASRQGGKDESCGGNAQKQVSVFDSHVISVSEATGP